MSETETMENNIIDIRDLSRRFGKKRVLKQIDLSVPPGGVFGLVGENGAGKTTLLKHILGLLKAQQGTVRVFGKNPVVDPKGVLSRIGYLSETREMPEWMRVHEYLDYTRAFYPGWDEAFANELLDTFDLDPGQKIKSLSRGQRAKTGLLAAMAYRPDLLYSTSPLPAWIQWYDGISWALSFVPLPKKGARCSCLRISWMKSSGWRTPL